MDMTGFSKPIAFIQKATFNNTGPSFPNKSKQFFEADGWKSVIRFTWALENYQVLMNSREWSSHGSLMSSRELSGSHELLRMI